MLGLTNICAFLFLPGQPAKLYSSAPLPLCGVMWLSYLVEVICAISRPGHLNILNTSLSPLHLFHFIYLLVRSILSQRWLTPRLIPGYVATSVDALSPRTPELCFELGEKKLTIRHTFLEPHHTYNTWFYEEITQFYKPVKRISWIFF